MPQPNTRRGDEWSKVSGCSNHQNLADSHYYSVLFALMGRIKTKIKKALTCINQHPDFPTPYAIQFYKLDIPSLRFQAMSITK
jgi:hypothetical protein